MPGRYYALVTSQTAVISDSWEQIIGLTSNPDAYKKLKKFETVSEAWMFLLEHLDQKDITRLGVGNQPPMLNEPLEPKHTFRWSIKPSK